MSYIQLPYGFVKNNKQIQFNLPSDFEELGFLLLQMRVRL